MSFLRLRPALVVLTAALGIGLSAAPFRPIHSNAKTFDPKGFVIEQQVLVPVGPEEAFDAFTGDISGWWDHRFSENPSKFVLEPRPGGGFWEIFDEQGNGALHARVTYAQRGEKLVFRGPLGLHGQALDMVHTILFEPEGSSTRVRASVHGFGEVTDTDVTAIEGVWYHFLVKRFGPYVEEGRHRER